MSVQRSRAESVSQASYMLSGLLEGRGEVKLDSQLLIVPSRSIAEEFISDLEFFLGKSEQSGREGFIVYMGKDIFGVKWRNWKIHFKEQTAWNGVLREYTMPRVYNLMNDPRERDNVIFPHTWVLKAGLPQLEQHVASLRANPPVPTGAPDPYVPPAR